VDAELRLELFETYNVFSLVLLARGLPCFLNVVVAQRAVRVSLDNFRELVVLHLLPVTEFSENLIQRLANTVEQFFDDLNDGVVTLSPLDTEELLIIIGQVVDDPRLEQWLTRGHRIWIDVVLQLANQLLDGADLAVPVEADLLEHALQVDDRDLVASVSEQHLNFGAADHVPEGEGGGRLLDHLDELLPVAVHLVREVHELAWRQLGQAGEGGLETALTENGLSSARFVITLLLTKN